MKTRIPIKRYIPRAEALANVATVLGEEYSENDPIRMIAEEFKRLYDHHEEETKFLIERIGELELLATD